MKNLYFLLITALLFSCKKEPTYQVDSTLDPYLQMFLQEASLRGFHFDVEKDGLLMKFSDLESPTIGLCTYTDPLLVEIDRTYWNDVTQYDNCEDLRQDVVFHELAHGLLNRRHDNAYLPNTEWKSLMCGGDEVDERSWAVNFTGYRKEYYLNELFNTSQEEPEWAESGITFSDESFLGDTIAQLDLSKTSHKIDNAGTSYDIKNGVYTITLNSESNTITNLYTGKIASDFYYETSLKSPITGNGDCVGIGVGYKNAKDSLNFNFFYIAKNVTYNQYRAYAINQRCLPPLAEVLLDKSCNLTEYTRLAIERKDDELYFFVNDQLVYHHDYEATATITRLCLIIPGNGYVSLNNAICRDMGTSSLSTKSTTHLEEETEPIVIRLPQCNYTK